MSCPEVVYQAYYPYLYQRASTSAVPPRTTSYPPYYDRLNVQQGYGPSVGLGAGSGGGSVSSGGGAPSPSSPPPTRHKDDTDHRDSDGRDDEDDDEHSEAQVLSATCVVFTNYEGDVASVVDQHFSRSFTQTKASFGAEKESRPMSARNFPPSFWNQSAINVSHGHGDLYSHGESMYHGATAHTPADPWHTHYQQYTAAAHHHRGLHEYHHHHQHMAGYGGLLLPPSPRIAPHAQYPKPVDWNHRLHHEQTAHHLDAASSYASYSNMAGLDAPVQESSKDLYWFG